ncbi:MAG: hypothetical protein D6770_04290 [Anaerolineae bacterium]|nr:MAG: hypothetical protein D6770_04290 [Anaerolineae bacterium]
MNPVLITLLVGFSYIVIFGGLSLFRREGLSFRFATESAAITVIAAAFSALTGLPLHPVLFLVVLYIISMRVRILVDLGTIFARRGQFNQADRLFALASRLWPDEISRLIVQLNQATSLLQQGNLDTAIAMYRDLLEQAEGRLSAKHEAAAHYNLGVAYLRKGMDAPATVEFNAVIDTWPASPYARYAEAALERRRRKGTSISQAKKHNEH